MSRVAVMDRASRTARPFPLESKIGLLVMALGIGADLVASVNPELAHGHGTTTGVELSAHLVVFVGMALVLLGVVIGGVRSGRRSPGRDI